MNSRTHWIRLNALDVLPPATATLDAITAWHVRRAIATHATYQAAADALGISRKTLWALRDRHDITIRPGGSK
jgi:hypothetical protein